MSTNQDTELQKEKNLSPADYKDFDLDKLQIIGDYISRNSIPQGLTIAEGNEILHLYTELINLSLHNLNILRTLAGDDLFPVPRNRSGDNDEFSKMA